MFSASNRHITTMARLGLKCCSVTLILSYIFTLIIAEEHNGNDQLMNAAHSQDFQWYIRHKPGIWLAPHMGRKKRDVSPFEENYRTLDQEQLEFLLEAIQIPPWDVVAINGGKRNTFTPRLGRELGEENESNVWLLDKDLNRDVISQRSSPFAPRLGRGRSAYHFDPRLGKRNS